jgi:hypothetical protein
MTSATSSFPQRLTEIDQLTRSDHTFLTEGDRCFFLGDYTARKGFAYSVTNNLIINFKKPMSVRGTPQWPHKERAIAEAAGALANALGPKNLQNLTFVPVPPSKAKTDPMYDDRVRRMLFAMGTGLDIRELVIQEVSTTAAHESETRLRPEELANYYAVDPQSVMPTPTAIAICDDVLTTGCHYRAMVSVLSPHFPDAKFYGLFLARRVPQPPEFEVVDIDF